MHEWLAPLSNKPVFFYFPIPMGNSEAMVAFENNTTLMFAA